MRVTEVEIIRHGVTALDVKNRHYVGVGRETWGGVSTGTGSTERAALQAAVQQLVDLEADFGNVIVPTLPATRPPTGSVYVVTVRVRF